jgi:formate/nitrite transporter FocA (FNT family)
MRANPKSSCPPATPWYAPTWPGAILALAAAFAITVTVQTGQPLLGAVLFPVGFILLYLLGFDLLTGVFTLTPLALIDKRPGVTVGGILRNWTLVFFGNFAGALTVAVMMAIIWTFGFTEAPNTVAQKIGTIGEAARSVTPRTARPACSPCSSVACCATGWCPPAWSPPCCRRMSAAR